MSYEKLIKMKKEEDLLRNLYVIDRDNSMLDDPYLHLVSVYGPDHQLRELEFSKYEPPKGIGLLFDFEDPVVFKQAKLNSLSTTIM